LEKNPKNLEKKDQIPAKENEMIKKNNVFEAHGRELRRIKVELSYQGHLQSQFSTYRY